MCNYGYTAFFIKKFFWVGIEQAESKMCNNFENCVHYKTNQKLYENLYCIKSCYFIAHCKPTKFIVIKFFIISKLD